MTPEEFKDAFDNGDFRFHTWRGPQSPLNGTYRPDKAHRFLLNKSTHRVRFENESESEVTIVIEPKEGSLG